MDIFTEKENDIIIHAIGNPYLTNCYLAYDEIVKKMKLNEIYCLCHENIVLLIHRVNQIHKIYYFIKNSDHLSAEVLKKIQEPLKQYPNLIAEVVTKESQRDSNILERLGFIPYKKYIRKQMLASSWNKHKTAASVKIADERDLDDIFQLLYETFDIMSDYLVSREELLIFITLSHVLKISIDNKIAGVLLFETHGKKSYLRALCVSNRFTGQKIGLSLMEDYIERNIKETKLFYLWVMSTNKTAVHLYEELGYEDDGLCEYIYLYKR